MIENIVEELKEKGVRISNEEVRKICNLCKRKMQVAGVKNQEEYFPFLFEDEIKNYLFRRIVTSASMLMLSNKEIDHV